MFCRNCGHELQDGWVRCPYCGSNVNIEKDETEYDKHPKDQQTGQTKGNVTSEFETLKDYGSKIIKVQDSKEDFLIGNWNISGRMVLKICALIAIICYFCPMYMVSCGAKEVGNLSGFDFTVGFSYMNQKIPGNIEFCLLLLLPVISFGLCFAKVTETDLEVRTKELRETTYFSTICMAMVLWFYNSIHGKIDEAASQSILQVTPLFAEKISLLAAWVFVACGTFLAYILEPREKNGKLRSPLVIGIISLAKIIGISLVALAFLLVILEKMFPVEYMQG